MRRPYSYKDKDKAKGRNRRSSPKRHASPKSPASKTRTKIQDTAPCSECGLQVYEHPRCTVCNRFMWCTAQQRTDAGELVHSHGCQP